MKNYDVRISTMNGWKYGMVNKSLAEAKSFASNFNEAMMASAKAAYESGHSFVYEEAIVVEHNDNVPV